MKVGVQVYLNQPNIDEKLSKVRNMGFDYFQLCIWNQSFFTKEIAEQIVAACEKYSLKISSLWCGWSGPTAWNFTEGPITLGLVPPEYRFQRMNDLMRGSDFAKMINVDKMATHVGFIPENLTDPNYLPVVAAVKTVANYCKKNGQHFLFETGQETPITLLRVIEDSGCENLGINYDTANLILYGKANPVDGLDVVGKYVMDVHAKDGDYPTDGKHLGKERKIGEGRVDFPKIIEKLKALGYDGTITIEREISGEQQTKDIAESKIYLEGLIG
jgi:sugar phosphate isomerase/epimerase